MTRLTPITLSFVAVIAAAACAGSSADPRAQLDRTFRDIQVQEAGIAHSRATLARRDVPCCAQCAASASAAVHAGRVCQLARAAADVDALSRCDQAERTSSGLGADARARCRCSRD